MVYPKMVVPGVASHWTHQSLTSLKLRKCRNVTRTILPVTSPAKNNAQNALLQADLKVVCYGDSNTAGWCLKGAKFEPYACWLHMALLTAGRICEVSHAGLCGLTAAEMVATMNAVSIHDCFGREEKGLMQYVEKNKPDLVIIMAGTNDLGKGAQPECILRNIASLHEACHVKGVQTIAVAPPGPMSCLKLRDCLAAMLQVWAGANSNVVAYCDVEDLLPHGAHGYWEPDEFHFSPVGSRALGNRLCPLVMQCKK